MRFSHPLLAHLPEPSGSSGSTSPGHRWPATPPAPALVPVRSGYGSKKGTATNLRNVRYPPVPCLCGYRGSIGENDLVWVRLTQKECEEGEPNPKTIDGRRLTRRKKSWVNPTEHLTTGVNPGKHLIYCKTTFKSCLIDIFLFPMEILNESAES